jgi:hypothetical protein
MDFSLSPADKDVIALYGDDLDAATEAVLSRLTDSLRPQLRLQVQHEINWQATYRDITEKERAAHFYLLACPHVSSTPSRPVYESFRVGVDLLDAFVKQYRLDKGKVLKLAAGEIKEHKGWIAHPLASGKYCLNAAPKPAKEHLSLAEGLAPRPFGAMLEGPGDPRKPAPVFLPTKTYKE